MLILRHIRLSPASSTYRGAESWTGRLMGATRGKSHVSQRCYEALARRLKSVMSLWPAHSVLWYGLAYAQHTRAYARRVSHSFPAGLNPTSTLFHYPPGIPPSLAEAQPCAGLLSLSVRRRSSTTGTISKRHVSEGIAQQIEAIYRRRSELSDCAVFTFSGRWPLLCALGASRAGELSWPSANPAEGAGFAGWRADRDSFSQTTTIRCTEVNTLVTARMSNVQMSQFPAPRIRPTPSTRTRSGRAIRPLFISSPRPSARARA